MPSDATDLLGKAVDARPWSWGGYDGVYRPILPGESLDGFVLTSYGPPGIRNVEFQPSDESIEAAALPGVEDFRR